MSLANYLTRFAPFPSETTWKQGSYSAQQAGANVWTPAAGKRIMLAYLSIAGSGATNGIITVWFGPLATTVFVAGTHQPVIIATLDVAPAAGTTATPTIVLSPGVPIYANAADLSLKATTSAGVTVDLVAYGCEV